MDKSLVYDTLDVKVLSGKKFITFTLIYNTDKCVLLTVSSARKDIVGSYNIQSGGSSDHVIKKIVQAY